jgi:hypothetical protein
VKHRINRGRQQAPFFIEAAVLEMLADWDRGAKSLIFKRLQLNQSPGCQPQTKVAGEIVCDSTAPARFMAMLTIRATHSKMRCSNAQSAVVKFFTER